MIAGRIFAVPLLMAPEKLHFVIEDLIGPRIGVALSGNVENPYYAAPDKKGVRRYGRVGVIDVRGTLVQDGAWVGTKSGLVSYEWVSKAAEDFTNDPSIDFTIMTFRTPGGEVPGCFECADKINELQKKKPIYAMVDAYATSAGMALASACTEMWVSETARVGSVGVVLTLKNIAEAEKKDGIKTVHVYAGERKVDGSPFIPLTDKALERFQADIDSAREIFVGRMSKYTGIDGSFWMDSEARTWMGAEIVDVGIAKGITAFDGLMEAKMSKEKWAAVAKAAGVNVSADAEEAIAKLQESAAKLALEEERAKIRAEQERKDAILALEDAQGRGELAKTLADTPNMGVEEAKRILASTERKVAFEDDDIPVGASDMGASGVVIDPKAWIKRAS